MLHILFSILISLGTATGFVVQEDRNFEKTHEVETYDKVLLSVDEDFHEF